VDFTRIDGDDVARTRLDDTPATGRFLRAALDQADAELIVGVAAEDERRVRCHGLDAVSSTPQQGESLVLHAWPVALRTTGGEVPAERWVWT